MISVAPPDQPQFLQLDGKCKVKGFRRRRVVHGVDRNGQIAFTLCRKQQRCCTFTATGPSSPDPVLPTPVPSSMTGPYTCPERSGVFSLAVKPPG